MAARSFSEIRQGSIERMERPPLTWLGDVVLSPMSRLDQNILSNMMPVCLVSKKGVLLCLQARFRCRNSLSRTRLICSLVVRLLVKAITPLLQIKITANSSWISSHFLISRCQILRSLLSRIVLYEENRREILDTL